MAKDTLAANAAAMFDRRAALGSIAAAGALFAVPGAAYASGEPDAEIATLSAEIVRWSAEAGRYQRECVDPHHDKFVDLLHDPAQSEQARAFSVESGHQAAVETVNAFEDVTTGMFKRQITIPATTQAGRAAKVRALLTHVMRDGWRGPPKELDWDVEMARALLGEFAGLTPAELATI
jgi:hypothetical protein